MARLPQPGELLQGRYRVLRKLAAGGMGLVFEAEEVGASRKVAVKMLHPELAQDREMHRRFKREGSVLQALTHPAVVRVFDVGTDELGRCFTVMELLEGETLFARIQRDGPYAPQDLEPIVQSLASALQAAHDHGVIHGDLKPPNVFLVSQPDGGVAVKLVDFGTSKVHGLERLTRTGEIIGTPTYMAPELLTGEGEIDERIDVYALGVVAYEALCGKIPFTERQPGKLLFQIVMGQGVPLSDVAPQLGLQLVEVVAKAMAPKPAQRYVSVREMATAFSAALEAS